MFLSYRSVNRRWTFALYDTLVEAGFNVFVDQVELKPGGSLRKQLQKSLEASASGVLIWSTDAADSGWVEEEFNAMDVLVKDRKDSDFPFHRLIATLDERELPLFARDSLRTEFHDHPHGPTGGELMRLMVGLTGQSLGKDRAQFVQKLDEETAEITHSVQAARDVGDAAWLTDLAFKDSLAITATPAVLNEIADALIALRKIDESFPVIQRGLSLFPKAVRLRQLKGLALRRKGDNQEAQRVLGVLYAEGHRDPETMGIYAATWAKRYDAEGDETLLTRSQQLYEEAFRLDPRDGYCGINAASKAALLGDAEKARSVAAEVLKLEPITQATKGKAYWDIATHAEARLLSGDYDAAAGLYQAAVTGSSEEHGSHGTTLEQLEKLITKLNVPADAAAKLRAPFDHLKR